MITMLGDDIGIQFSRRSLAYNLLRLGAIRQSGVQIAWACIYTAYYLHIRQHRISETEREDLEASDGATQLNESTPFQTCQYSASHS
jgi:hypothetical protein